MRAHGLHRQVQPLGDLGDRLALGEQRKTSNSRSERRACGGPFASGIAPSASCSATAALMKAPPAATLRIAPTSCARGAVLGEVARGAGPERAHRVLLLVVHAEHQDAQLRLLGLHPLDELDAALARHRHVEQQQVEVERAHPRERLVAVLRLARDLRGRRAAREELLQAVAHDGVVVGEHDADHAVSPLRRSTGMRTRQRVPPPRRAPTSTVAAAGRRARACPSGRASAACAGPRRRCRGRRPRPRA